MKNNILFLLIVLMMSGISDKMNAREVTSFNDGWEFKKGPSRRNYAGRAEMEYGLARSNHPSYVECR